jgi:hypothetical protein
LYAVEKVISNWHSTHEYAMYRKQHDEFYVKALKYENFKDNMSDCEEYCKFVIPRYQRTRRVFVRQHGSGQLYLSCSCLCYEAHGYGCQHIFAVLGQSKPPSPTDVVICWHKSYDRLYMKGDEDTDRLFDDLFENETPGPAVVSCDSIKNFRSDILAGHGEKPLSFFAPMLPGKTPMLQPGIKWANIVKNTGATTMVQQQQHHCGQIVPSSGVLRQMVSLSQHAIASQATDQQGTHGTYLARIVIFDELRAWDLARIVIFDELCTWDLARIVIFDELRAWDLATGRIVIFDKLGYTDFSRRKFGEEI